MTTATVRTLRHSKVSLALHTLRDGAGPALLLLHGLGEASPDTPPLEITHWPGAIHALDFTGHGASGPSVGGGYTAELLMADADSALAAIGPATVCGRGLGAYVALLIAGGRPALVRGAILLDGPGIAGGGSQPTAQMVLHPDPHASGPPDPFAMIELARDLRPPDYATSFARQAVQHSPLDAPISVVARQRPAWLSAVVEEPGVHCTTLGAALTGYADGGQS